MGVGHVMRGALARIAPPRLLKMASWTTASFGFVQAVRLATNVLLARLLSPELFGLMLIINTLRTGADLFRTSGLGRI